MDDQRSQTSTVNSDIKVAGVQYQKNSDAVYGDHIRDTMAVCNSSATHTYGNVISVIEHYLTQSEYGFPKDLFKNGTVTISTTLSSRQLRHMPQQLYKKEMPIMVLSPRISFGQGDDRFLGNTLINDRVTDTHALWGNGSLLELAVDQMNDIWINGHYNRGLMFIDVVISFNTFAEQMNYMSYIHNILGVNHPKFIRTPLEILIPSEFCSLISNLGNVPIHGKDGSVSGFIQYMNTHWHYPITYKLNGGSNTDEFFMYYLTDLDLTIGEPTPGGGNKDGQIKRGFEISFTIRCEFNTIGYFTLNNPRIPRNVHIATKDSDRTIEPIFSDVIDLNDFKLPLGWKLLCWPIFKLKIGDNHISIDSILNDSLRAVIDYHLKMNLPMEKFISIQFRENGYILDHELFHIDWANRDMVILNPDYRRTYRLIVAVSIEYINNLIKELYDLE